MTTRRINPEVPPNGAGLNSRARRDSEDIALRRAQRHRWASLRAREDQRSYREHLAMLEPDEPIFGMLQAYDRMEAAD